MGRAAVDQNSRRLRRYKRSRIGQLPSRTVKGCTGIPEIGQLPSRTVHGCAGLAGVGQLPSISVEGCAGITRVR